MTTRLDRQDFDELVDAVAEKVLSALTKSAGDSTLSFAGPAGSREAIERARGRFVSEGMLNLASAVTYKLGKADPQKQEFNRIASGVAKLLFEEKRNKEELPVYEGTS